VPRSRGFSRGIPGTSSRRRTGWEEGPGTASESTITSSSAAILGNGQTFQLDGLTVVRLRGFVELRLEGAGSAAGSGYTGALGIGIVTTAAFAVGSSAVPTPITEIEWEGWMWHQLFSLTVGDATAGDRHVSPLAFQIDSKAMRKVGSDETIFASIEVVEKGTETLSVILASRMLLKLP